MKKLMHGSKLHELELPLRNNKGFGHIVRKSYNTYKSEYKGICLLIGVLALLSIGMCIQANSLAQALRELARISVQQTIR